MQSKRTLLSFEPNDLKIMMKFSNTNEQAFEALIEKALIGTTREEREAMGLNRGETQHPGEHQYYWGMPKDMDKKLALDMRRLWSFLEATQSDELAKRIRIAHPLVDTRASHQFLSRYGDASYFVFGSPRRVLDCAGTDSAVL